MALRLYKARPARQYVLHRMSKIKGAKLLAPLIYIIVIIYLKRRLRVAKSFKRRALSWIKPAASF